MVYVLAQLRFTEESRYRRYQALFPTLFARSGGRLLAADERPELLEGDWLGDKVVLMAFETRADALRFLESPAYQEISEHRRAGAETTALLVEGIAARSLSPQR